jgi:hypothetical protein
MTPHTVERAPQKQASPLASAPLRHVILTPPSKTVQDAAPPTPAPQAQTEPIEHIADTGASNAYACVAAQDIEPEPGVTKLPLKNTRGKGEIFTPDGSVRLGINGYYMLTWNLIFAQESDARQVSLGHNDHNVHLTGANGNTQYAGQQVGWFFADDDLCLRLSAENEKDYAKKHRVDHAELTVIQLA